MPLTVTRFSVQTATYVSKGHLFFFIFTYMLHCISFGFVTEFKYATVGKDLKYLKSRTLFSDVKIYFFSGLLESEGF